MIGRPFRAAAAGLLLLGLGGCGGAVPARGTRAVPTDADPPHAQGGTPFPSASLAESPRDAAARGIRYLLDHQNPDGSWGSGHRRPGDILAAVPGAYHAFQTAASALCTMALIAHDDGSPEIDAAVARGGEHLLRMAPRVRRANRVEIYNVWTHTYLLQAFVRLARRAADPGRAEPFQAAAQEEIRLLELYESILGGWGYYDFAYGMRRPTSQPTSFTTGAILTAFYEARAAGLDVPQRPIDRGLYVVRNMRAPDGTYAYSWNHRWYPMYITNRDKGSLSRMQPANLGLFLWEDTVDPADLAFGVERFIDLHHFLELARKRPVPHESWYHCAGYYYHFGVWYAAQVTAHLEDPGLQARARTFIGETLARQQEPDGSWWDFPMFQFHKAYGTGLALLSLADAGF